MGTGVTQSNKAKEIKTMTRACIDCRWCDWPAFATGELTAVEITAACFHPKAKATTSAVTGPAGDRGRPATLMRRELVVTDAVCGPLGLLWEGRGGKAVTP